MDNQNQNNRLRLMLTPIDTDELIHAACDGILDSLTPPERFRLRLVTIAKQRERVRRLQRLYRKRLVAWAAVANAIVITEDLINAELRCLARESGRPWLGVGAETVANARLETLNNPRNDDEDGSGWGINDEQTDDSDTQC